MICSISWQSVESCWRYIERSWHYVWSNWNLKQDWIRLSHVGCLLSQLYIRVSQFCIMFGPNVRIMSDFGNMYSQDGIRFCQTGIVLGQFDITVIVFLVKLVLREFNIALGLVKLAFCWFKLIYD